MYRKRIDFLSLISNPNGTSRIQLSRATGRSPAKIGKLVQQLLNAGILTEEAHVETSRGRRPILLKPSRSLGSLLGVDIGMANARVLVTDMQGSIRASVEIPSNAKADADTALAGIFASVDSVLSQAVPEREKLLAVGVSHSGGIDPQSGVCLYWHRAQHWKGAPLKKIFSERYGAPCEVDDSVHCQTLAEKTYGAAKDEDTFILINIGEGIGSGLFLEGQLFRGTVGIAGELGHTTILPGGPQCSCGNRGCLEILASGRSMVDSATAAINENVTTSLRDIVAGGTQAITVDAISGAARSGDRLARMIINQAGTYIGIAVANLINLINPPLIVFAGGAVAASDDLLMDAIIREASASAFEVAYSKTRIVRSPLDSLSAARGAALMVTRPALREFWHKAIVSPGSIEAYSLTPAS